MDPILQVLQLLYDSIVSGHGFYTHACHTNQPNKSKPALYKPLIHMYSHAIKTFVTCIKDNALQLYRWVWCVCVGIILVLMCLKEELAWATDKWLWVISIIMLFRTIITLFKTILYALPCGP